MRTQIVTQPVDEPLELEEVRQHLRNPEATGSAADDEVYRWIQAAREAAEQRTGRALLTQTWDVYLDGFPGICPIELPYPPLQSVTSVKYLDGANVLQTVSAADYTVNTAGALATVALNQYAAWPVSLYGVRNNVVIRIKVGYVDAEFIPASIKQWMLLAITWQNEHRGRSADRQVFDNAYADRLLDRYRMVGV